MKANQLRKEIRKHALAFAKRRNLPIDDSYASALIFSNLDDCFHPESLSNIRKTPEWEKRTQKAHQNVPEVLEMQSSNSSDALLMNVFCHPSIKKWKGIKQVFGNELESIKFGVPGAVRKNGHQDSTEIDMVLSGVFCEAKLTEDDFTQKSSEVVEDYDELKSTFHDEALPRVGTDYDNYQIIRNLLAAKQHDCSHILICDGRRPDLIRRYFTVVSCLRKIEWRKRCQVVLWQEIVAACGVDLREWVEEKYGF